TISEEERQRLAERIGSPANDGPDTLRRLVAVDPSNIELRKALVSTIMSAEFAGVDAFSRKVVEWQHWDVPHTLIMAMARQTWDEVRHAQLAIGLLESYEGHVGEYPDSLAGGQGGAAARQQQRQALGDDPADPLISLSTTNVSLEGAALALFQGTCELGRQIDDPLMEHCYDYNWADEVTHTAIGDWFVKRLCDGDPEQEQRALRAHARHERMRAQLSGDQTEEIRRFFAEEDERGASALG
ncbi:MAG: hypothetical protein IT429_01170, partial [Gemmataceae bacterium]|nr:hypothetical protein [Gemmataceae bacterium]